MGNSVPEHDSTGDQHWNGYYCMMLGCLSSKVLSQVSHQQAWPWLLTEPGESQAGSAGPLTQLINNKAEDNDWNRHTSSGHTI